MARCRNQRRWWLIGQVFLLATSTVAGCAQRQADAQPSVYVEAIAYRSTGFRLEGHDSRAVTELAADIEPWTNAPRFEANEGSGPEVTADRRAVVASRTIESGEFRVKVWQTARGTQTTGLIAGRPSAVRSSENFLLYETADCSRYIVRLDTWQSMPVPEKMDTVEVSGDGRWLATLGELIVVGRIGDDRLIEEMRIGMPEGAPPYGRYPHEEVYWFPHQNAAVLSTGVLVLFDSQQARLLATGSIIGALPDRGLIVHTDKGGRRLFATAVASDGSVSTERLATGRVRRGARFVSLSPSGHYAVARRGSKWPSDYLVRVKRFPMWGEKLPRRSRSLVGWLLVRNEQAVAQVDDAVAGRSAAAPNR